MIIQPPSVLLEGPTGTGKTDALTTYIEAGLELFVLVTEPTGVDSLLISMERRNLPIEKLHWHHITPATAGFNDLDDIAAKISVLSQDALAKLPPQGDRSKPKWREMLKSLSDFPCDRTSTSYGPVDSWDDSKALVVDSLTGISDMAWSMVVGTKPTAHPGEWQIAMGQIAMWLNRCTSNLKCHFALTAHVSREANEVTGAQQIMTSTLGSKLAPKIPTYFSEVILSRREGEQFFWSNTAFNVDLKKRALPFGDKHIPSFVPIVEAHKRRVSLAGGNASASTFTNLGEVT
jgi:hypothetical protein